MVKNILYLVSILFLILFLFNISSPREVGTGIKLVNFSNVQVKVELADSVTGRAKGLSGRTSLPEDEGMLFIFDRSDKYAFWMKDMNFAIDILWIEEDLSVVHIEKSVNPASYPQQFAPSRPAKYVLEVVAGFSDKYNVQIGDIVEFSSL